MTVLVDTSIWSLALRRPARGLGTKESALAQRHRVPIFTTDGDFEHYARCVALRLHAPR